MADTASAPVAQSFLTVELGGEHFAIPASDVAEVIRPPAVTRVPLGPAGLLGLANLRGAVMPVVALHQLLGRAGSPSPGGRVVVIDRGSPIGLLVDRVSSLGEAVSSHLPDDAEGVKRLQRIELDALLAKSFGGSMRRDQNRPSATRQRSSNGAVQAANQVTLLCFDVAGQDFALTLASVREVVAVPGGITVVPQLDSAMIGVMALRDRLLPLVSVHAILGLRAGSRANSRSRVVVARVGEGEVGLVVDGMKEILLLPESAIDPVPPILTRGHAEAQLQGICRLEGGQRLVSVLAEKHLLRDQTLLDQIRSQAEGKHEMGTSDAGSVGQETFVVFELGGEEYGLPIGSVDEVVRVPDQLTRLPKAPAFIEGVMNLRGRVVPVIDQRRRFQFEGAGERRRERIVVVRIDEMQAGFVVDRVSEVLSIPQDRLSAPPDLAGDGSQVIDHIANFEADGRMILLLSARELLSRAEKDLLASMSEESPERSIS